MDNTLQSIIKDQQRFHTAADDTNVVVVNTKPDQHAIQQAPNRQESDQSIPALTIQDRAPENVGGSNGAPRLGHSVSLRIPDGKDAVSSSESSSRSSVLARYIDRFRHAPPLSREARRRFDAAQLKPDAFWWTDKGAPQPSADIPHQAHETPLLKSNDRVNSDPHNASLSLSDDSLPRAASPDAASLVASHISSTLDNTETAPPDEFELRVQQIISKRCVSWAYRH